MLNKLKLLGKAGKLLKTVHQERESVIKASKPLAKKALGKISKGAIALGEKGRKIAEGLGEDPQQNDTHKE